MLKKCAEKGIPRVSKREMKKDFVDKRNQNFKIRLECFFFLQIFWGLAFENQSDD